jgi:hypothetical protein
MRRLPDHASVRRVRVFVVMSGDMVTILSVRGGSRACLRGGVRAALVRDFPDGKTTLERNAHCEVENALANQNAPCTPAWFETLGILTRRPRFKILDRNVGRYEETQISQRRVAFPTGARAPNKRAR